MAQEQLTKPEDFSDFDPAAFAKKMMEEAEANKAKEENTSTDTTE